MADRGYREAQAAVETGELARLAVAAPATLHLQVHHKATAVVQEPQPEEQAARVTGVEAVAAQVP